MNPLKIAEELVLMREEVRKTRLELERYEKKLDKLADDLIEFLKHSKLVETRTVI